MNTDSTDAAWAATRAAAPDSMSRNEIAGLLAEVRRARARLDTVELRASRRLRELAATGRSEPAESMLAGAGGHSGRDARSIAERDELCTEMPDVEDALTDGTLSAGSGPSAPCTAGAPSPAAPSASATAASITSAGGGEISGPPIWTT